MKKYHFTSKACAQKILVEGMIPYPFHNKEVLAIKEQLGDWNGKGLFLWDNKLSEVEELGSILWQMATKNTFEIVQLEVEVLEEDLLHSSWGGKVELFHDQTFVPSYHPEFSLHDKTPASVGTKRISPDSIRIVKQYDMMDLVR